MWKLQRHRRAVSPVLSTILLILIVVLGMSVAFAFFVSYVKDYQTGRGSSVLELVEIEDVWFKEIGANKTVEIWLYNYGKAAVNITAFYLDSLQANFSPNPVQIAVGKHESMSFVFSWIPGERYAFKLATERGSVFEREYVSPGEQR